MRRGARSVAVWAAAFIAAQAIGALSAVGLGVVAGPLWPWIVRAGLVLGAVAVVVRVVRDRRRPPRPSEDLDPIDRGVHGVLALNGVVLAATIGAHALATPDIRAVLLWTILPPGAVALLGVPASVALTCWGAWRPRADVGWVPRRRNGPVWASHGVNGALAIILLLTGGPF